MEKIIIERNQRIKMFFNEYYFGVSTFLKIFKLFGGPLIFYLGLNMYLDSESRFGIGYGGMAVVFAIYYTLKPFLWILIKWKYFKTVEFQLEATSDKLIIKEDESEAQTEYSKFEKIIRRKNYFVLRIQKGLQIYLPVDKLSEPTIERLTEKLKN